MILRGVKNMEIRTLVVPIVPVNVVDYFASLGIHHFAVLPFTAASLGPISKPERLERFRVGSVGFFYARAGGWDRDRELSNWTDHFVISANVRSVWKTLSLAFIGIKWVAVFAVHLIMPKAHALGDGLALAMQTRSPDNLPAPSVLRRAVALDALVVHQAKAVCRMLSSATVNRARRHKRSRFWLSVYGSWKQSNQALGNSWAVPCVAWIARRLTEALRSA